MLTIKYIKPEWWIKNERAIDVIKALKIVLKYSNNMTNFDEMIEQLSDVGGIHINQNKVNVLIWEDDRIFPIWTAMIPEILWHERLGKEAFNDATAKVEATAKITANEPNIKDGE